MSYKSSSEVVRHIDRHEWEALVGDGANFFVVSRKAATTNRVPKEVLASAHEVARDHEETVRLYHTYPSPGPTRRYVGKVTPEGVFHDARR